MPSNASVYRTRQVTQKEPIYSVNIPVQGVIAVIGESTRSVSSFTDFYFRQFSGSKTANWRAFRKTNGYLPTRASSDYIVRCTGVPIPWVRTKTISGRPGFVDLYSNHSNYVGYVSSVRAPTSQELQMAYFRLVDAVRDNDFNLAQFLAEFDKTVGFVAGVAKTISKAATQAKRGKWTRALKTLGWRGSSLEKLRERGARIPNTAVVNGALAKNWLGFKFAALPLVADARNAAIAAARMGRNLSVEKRTFKGTYKSTVKGLPPSPVPVSQYDVYDVSVVTKQWVVVTVNNPSLLQAWQLGLTNPIALAWELLPASWLADYVTEIGSFLSSLNAFQGLTIHDSGHSSKVTYTGKRTGALFANELGRHTNHFIVSQFTRDVGLSSGNVLTAATPKFSKVNLNRLTTAAAFLSVVLPKRFS